MLLLIIIIFLRTHIINWLHLICSVLFFFIAFIIYVNFWTLLCMFILRVIIREVDVYRCVCDMVLIFIYENVFKKSNIAKVYKILLEL